MQLALPGTSASGSASGLLSGIRVLEVAGQFGAYTTKLFADLGADVILIEPPQGSQLRRAGPFVDNTPGLERGLTFAYLNTSKRGVTLDLDRVDGQRLFRQLAAASDVIVESASIGAMEARGLGHEVLLDIRPSLVHTSITPFGRSGPYSAYAASDLVLMAMGGLLYLGGYPDAEPIRAGGNQAVLATDQFAAVGTMMALFEAEVTQQGRRVDVSAQECVTMALENAAHFYDMEGHIRRRTSYQQHAGMGVYPCSDGYVYLQARPTGIIKFWQPTVEWFLEEGAIGAEQLLDPKWLSSEWLKVEEAKTVFAEVFYSLARRRTKAELYQAAQERRIPLAPVNTPADVIQSAQLKHRGYFTSVKHGSLDRMLMMPGAPYKLLKGAWGIRRPAPGLAQHNAEVYGSLGLGAEDLIHLASEGVI